MNHGNNVRDDGGGIRNAPLVAEYVSRGDHLWVVGVVGARIHIIAQVGAVVVRAVLAVVVVVVVVPGVLEPGAKKRGQDDGDEEDDEREGDVGAGVDAGFEAADGAGDEFGAGPEEGDDARRGGCNDDGVDEKDIAQSAEAQADAHYGEHKRQRLQAQLDDFPDFVLRWPRRLKGLLDGERSVGHGSGIGLVSSWKRHLRWWRSGDGGRWWDLGHFGLLGGGSHCE